MSLYMFCVRAPSSNQCIFCIKRSENTLIFGFLSNLLLFLAKNLLVFSQFQKKSSQSRTKILGSFSFLFNINCNVNVRIETNEWINTFVTICGKVCLTPVIPLVFHRKVFVINFISIRFLSLYFSLSPSLTFMCELMSEKKYPRILYNYLWWSNRICFRFISFSLFVLQSILIKIIYW